MERRASNGEKMKENREKRKQWVKEERKWVEGTTMGKRRKKLGRGDNNREKKKANGEKEHGTRSVYSRKNPKSSLYCEISMASIRSKGPIPWMSAVIHCRVRSLCEYCRRYRNESVIVSIS
jgi:hypothetical protein